MSNIEMPNNAIPCGLCDQCMVIPRKEDLVPHSLADHPATQDWWPEEWCETALYICEKGHWHALCPPCEEESVS